MPDPLLIPWHSRQLRVRHDDPHLDDRRLRAAVSLASDTEGLRLVLETALWREYAVRVSDDGATVGLWRR